MKVESTVGTTRVLLAGEQSLCAAPNIHFLQALAEVPNTNTE
jgi:hypothetical protein